jgi:hypothetical protein
MALRVRHRPEQHSIENVEDRHRHTDAERERHHGRCRKRRCAAQEAEGISDVEPQIAEHADSPGWWWHWRTAARPIGLANQVCDARAFAELASGCRERLVVGRAGRACLVVALRQVLRELFDDLLVASGITRDLRQAVAHVIAPLHVHQLQA